MLNKIWWTEKDTYSMLSLTCGILKNKANECIYQSRNRLTDIENKLVVTSGEREVGRDI